MCACRSQLILTGSEISFLLFCSMVDFLSVRCSFESVCAVLCVLCVVLTARLLNY